MILVGPPGSGKGTQAAFISQQKGLQHISTGDILRAAISQKTPLGVKAKGYIDSGKLVPDAVVIDIVRDRLSKPDCKVGCLLDGFPRTIDQAEALQKLLLDLYGASPVVIELKVPDAVLLERIQKRGIESGRSDDTLDTATTRLKVFWEQTAPVIVYYRGKGLLKEVDGLGTVSEVSDRILANLK